jgi:hypothetical protein
MLLEIFGAHPDPDSIFEYIETIAEEYSAEFFGSRALRPVISNSRLAFAHRLKIAKIIARREPSYEWEISKWPRMLESHLALPWGIALARPLVEENPTEAFRLLSGWFSDRTPLRDGSSTVANVAGGLIYYFARSALAEAFALLIGDEREMANQTLRSVVAAFPDEVASLLEPVQKAGRSESELKVLDVAAQILGSDARRESKKKVVDISRTIYKSTVYAASRDAALECLLLAPKRRRRDESDALNRFAEEPWAVSPYVLVALSPRRLPELLETFRVAATRYNPRKLDFIPAIGYANGSESDRIAILEFLEMIAPEGAEDGYHISATLETMLGRHQHDEITLGDKLLAVSKKFFDRYRGTARVPLIYYSSGAGESRTLAAPLVDYFLARGLEPNEIRLLLQRCENWHVDRRQQLIDYSIRSTLTAEEPREMEELILFSLHWGLMPQTLQHLFETLNKNPNYHRDSPFDKFVTIARERGLKAARRAIGEEILG